MIRDKSRTKKEMNKISTWLHTSSCIQYLAEKTMAKQDILFGTTALFYKSMGLQGNIPWESKMENSNQGDLFGIKTFMR